MRGEELQGKLRLFGKPRLLTGDGNHVVLFPMAWRVLAIVAAGENGMAMRSFVSQTTWGVRKRSMLRKLIWDLKQIEGKNDLKIIQADDLAIQLDVDLYCDVRDLLAEYPTYPLRNVYQGEFVKGLLSDVPAWASWAEGQRIRLRGIYLKKATDALASSDLRRTERIAEARHLLQVDPGSEAALRAEMLSDAIEGDQERVRQGYAGMAARLDGAGKRPADATRDLYVRLIGNAGAGESVTEPPRGIDPAVPTICLLPPVAPAPTPASRLAQSLVADVTIGLCRKSLLKVLAPHTAAQMPSAEQIFGFGASYLLTVNLIDHAVGGDQVVCTLSSLPDGRVLWSDRIDAADRYSVRTYNLLTAWVLRSVINHVDQATIEAFALKTEPSSYVDFLLGQATLSSLDLRQIRRGRQHLRRAVDRSPGFAPAVSALARSYQLEWLVTARGDAEIFDRSQHYARAAVMADPYEARGYRELGFCNLYRRRFDHSIENYETAERLNPHYADVLAEYADALIHDGQPAAALDKINRAISLNPLCQDTYFWAKGSALYFLERYDDAITCLNLMKDRSPTYRLLAAVHAQKGDIEQASWCRTKAMEIYPELNLEKWLAIVPFRDPRQVQHYREGLQLAGF